MNFLIDIEDKKATAVLMTLEKNLENEIAWKKQQRVLFRLACHFLNIPHHIEKEILRIDNHILIDNIIWKYLSSIDLIHLYRGIEKRKHKKKPKGSKMKEEFVYVELLQPFGFNNSLPGKEIFLKNSAYIFNNNKPFIITKGSSFFDYNEEEYDSEISWTHKESAILIAIINLSSNMKFSFFMGDFGFSIPIKENKIKGNPYSVKNCTKIKKLLEIYYYVHTKTADFPTIGSNDNFAFSNDVKVRYIKELDLKIDRKNNVLLRCLYYFGKACSLSHHKMLMEESTALQLFALDGIIKLLMKKYKLNSFENFKNFLKNEHNCPYADYLEELYDERTTYVHPQNNILENWCPAWQADTCLETISILRELILFYINGKLEITRY